MCDMQGDCGHWGSSGYNRGSWSRLGGPVCEGLLEKLKAETEAKQELVKGKEEERMMCIPSRKNRMCRGPLCGKRAQTLEELKVVQPGSVLAANGKG